MGAGRSSGEGRDEPHLPVTEQPEPEKGRALHPAVYILCVHASGVASCLTAMPRAPS